MRQKTAKLEKLARLIRYYILTATSQADSGHPTTCLSATDLLTVLFFEEFRFDFANKENIFNDRLIFSKGHAAPLLYSLYKVAGLLTEEELLKLRQLDSPLEGHPTTEFKYCEVATGSLGQGLSVGLGMALAIRTQLQKQQTNIKSLPRVFVLLGDGEMAEGAVWEAVQLASHYKLNNLIGLLDVNRLGQSGETMVGWQVEVYQKRLAAFGFKTLVIDGHNFQEIRLALAQIRKEQQGFFGQPVMLIAKTIKGKGVAFLEDQPGWHGKALDQAKLKQALQELGKVDKKLTAKVHQPKISQKPAVFVAQAKPLNFVYQKGQLVATRQAYGEALQQLGGLYPNLVVLDADVQTSTYAVKFKEKFPQRFFEMFIAEQNMIAAALGMAKRGFLPFVSTFAAFLTRAYDQIRMAALSKGNLKICGSHAGVSVGEDGASQMGLEDIAMFQAVFGSVIFYPADAVATLKLTALMAQNRGLFYLRTTRGPTPVIYSPQEEFKIGGSKVHYEKQKAAKKDLVVVAAAGITLFEALAAQQELAKQKISLRVIDCYSVKPIDGPTLRRAAQEAKAVITVEDHWKEGGLGDSVLQALGEEIEAPVYKLAVTSLPHSGKSYQLLAKAGINKEAIIAKVTEVKQRV